MALRVGRCVVRHSKVDKVKDGTSLGLQDVSSVFGCIGEDVDVEVNVAHVLEIAS